ncbi:MAG: adenylyl-sulfate kinase [Spirochaetia bacterium]|nr:adenylyl-sulfate kinase [Spirochaetia bacterium]
MLIDPVTHNTAAVGMIIDRMESDDLPSRISDADWGRLADGGSLVGAGERVRRWGQRGATVWVTGLHGSGKKRLVYGLERHLFDLGAACVVLDGGAIRSGLSRELDFSAADRAEHLRRVAHICRLLNEQGLIVLCSFISPAEDIRRQVRGIIGEEEFRLVYMDAGVEYCRGAAGDDLYQRAEEGRIEDMPGVDSRYDVPQAPALVIKPAERPIDEQISTVLDYLHVEKIFPAT